MTEAKFSIGDPVWSKMKGYCPWPSRIANPNESTLKNNDKTKTNKPSYLVYFFGSNNFAWMSEDTIKPYEEFKEKNKNGAKNVQFKQGIKQIEEYIANGGQKELIEATSAINQDNPASPASGKSSADGDDTNNPSNDDGGLHSIDEELDIIKNKKPATNSASSRKSLKNSHDSHLDSSSITSPIQKDYSRTPFKQGRKAVKTTSDNDASTTDSLTSPNKRIKTSTTTDDDDHYETSSPNVSSTSIRPPTHKIGPRYVISRGSYNTDMPVLDTPKVDKASVLPKYKNVNPSRLKFGFVGVGFMGQRLLKHLISTGHTVTIWNRTNNKCNDFIEAGAKRATTAADVVSASDIVFLCVSNPQASKETVFGSFGILAGMNENKALVEMSSIDPETSIDISEAIISKGGRYLEAPIICSSKSVADQGELVILAAGCRALFDDCKTCFDAMSKKTFFISSGAGTAAKMNLIVSMLYGSIVGAVSESCSLIDRFSIHLPQFQEILKLSIMNCPLIDDFISRIKNKRCEVSMPLGSLQKDLRLVLNMSEEQNSSIPIAAVTNEVFKNALKVGYDSADVTAVYFSRY